MEKKINPKAMTLEEFGQQVLQAIADASPQEKAEMRDALKRQLLEERVNGQVHGDAARGGAETAGGNRENVARGKGVPSGGVEGNAEAGGGEVPKLVARDAREIPNGANGNSEATQVRMARLNGWKRIGIIASIAWILGAGLHRHGVVQRRYSEMDVEDTLNCEKWLAGLPDIKHCDWYISDPAQLKAQAEDAWFEAALVGFTPVPLGWGFAYLILFLVRWVKRGFAVH